MELQQLRYFKSVARLQHMSRAAIELGVAQPSLSKSIRLLETELGVSLFERKSRGIKLNVAGQAFLRHVDAMFQALDDGTRELADIVSVRESELAVSAVALRWAAGLFKAFATKYPGVRLRLYQRTPDEMVRQMARREVDLCLMINPGVKEVEWIPLVTGDLYAMLPPEHRLQGAGSAPFREFVGEPIILPRAGGPLRKLIEQCFLTEGRTPNIVCESDDVSAMSELVTMGLGVQFLPDLGRVLARSGGPQHVRIVAPTPMITVGIAWPAGGYHSEAALSFASFAHAHVKALGG